MFCIVSFVVLSIMSIFSASNRQLAREALDCVFRRVTLRPCNTGFDEKIKAKLLGVVITRTEKGARFLNKNFELLSWISFIIMLVASFYFIRGLFLFYTTGSCNGVNNTGFCVFDPTGSNNQTSANEACPVPIPGQDNSPTLKGIDLSPWLRVEGSDGSEIVMIGCYHCDYTRESWPIIQKLVDRFDPSFTYINVPTKEPDDSFTRLQVCVNTDYPEIASDFNNAMFAHPKADLDDPQKLDSILTSLNMDADKLNACVESPETKDKVVSMLNDISLTRYPGTPTIFIGDEVFVGPKPFRVYAIALKGFFYWMK
ncbi:MAG TPA: thioredoxin domain-containing protein [Bellilinea sp.]|nr:thioredoxin domain-containing protein [Bellilinea sp.]